MCVHGNKHIGHHKIEIDDAAANVRAEQLARYHKMMWPGGSFRSAHTLTAQLQKMKDGQFSISYIHTAHPPSAKTWLTTAICRFVTVLQLYVQSWPRHPKKQQPVLKHWSPN